MHLTTTRSFAYICVATTMLLGVQVLAKAQTPYPVGQPLGITNGAGTFEAMSPGVSVYGGVVSAESCVYDPTRQLILLFNRGNSQRMQANDAWVSMMRSDGSLHTVRWIGAQGTKDRDSLSPPLQLNDPFGSEIANGMLYVADADGGTGPDDPRVSVVRRFDLQTGAPAGDFRIEGSPWINDLAVDAQGNMYATQTGDFGDNPDPDTWQVIKVSPDGTVERILKGAPLFQPNGIALDGDGNLVVVNMGNANVLTLTPSGKTVRTEQAAQAGSDGIVITADGTKYVSSVWEGGISRLRAGQPAELIATGIPGAASMCYDPSKNQLVIPMTSQSGVALVGLE